MSKELKAETIVPQGCTITLQMYPKAEADKVIAEKDKEIAELKKKLMPCLNGDCILTCEVVEKYGKENAELKQKLEDAKASHYAEMVDAGMENRRLHRELWLARAERALAEAEYWYGHPSGMYYIDATDVPDDEDDPYKRVKDSTIGWYKTWMNVERKCRAKAEEYKK